MSERWHALWGDRLFKIDRKVRDPFALNWLWRQLLRPTEELDNQLLEHL